MSAPDLRAAADTIARTLQAANPAVSVCVVVLSPPVAADDDVLDLYQAIPGRSRRWIREHAPEIPGARRVGRGFVISRGDARRYLESLPSTQRASAPQDADLDALGFVEAPAQRGRR